MRKGLLFIIALCIALTAGANRRKKVRVEALPQPDMPALCLSPDAPLAASAEPGFYMAPEPEPEPEPDNRIRGIDVSHHNGDIDWRKVAADPSARYCYIKATEGANFVDSRYRQNLRAARASGVKVGAYHFFSPSASPVQQLQNMTANVKLAEQDLIPIIDVEHLRRRQSVTAFVQRLRTFLVAVERHYGVRPIIYTGMNFYNNYLAGHFTGYRFMIAKYREPEPVLNDPQTVVLMWQYTSTGTINGVRGNCDQSVFLKDYGMDDILLKK